MSKLLDFMISSCRYYDVNDLEVKNITELAKGVRNKKILDVGCGIGRLTSKLSKKDTKIIGIDINKEFISYCSKKFRGIEFLVADARKLPFAKDTFDIVLYPWMGDLGKELPRALKECKRVLKKNGKFIVIEGLTESNYGRIIYRFSNTDEITSYYAKILKHQLQKIYKKKMQSRKIDIPYIFPDLKIAYKTVKYELEDYRNIKLSKNDKNKLKKILSQFIINKKVIINESVIFYSYSKSD